MVELEISGGKQSLILSVQRCTYSASLKYASVLSSGGELPSSKHVRSGSKQSPNSGIVTISECNKSLVTKDQHQPQQLRVILPKNQN